MTTTTSASANGSAPSRRARRLAGVVTTSRRTPSGLEFVPRSELDDAAFKALEAESRRMDDPWATLYRDGLVQPRVSPRVWASLAEGNSTLMSAVETIAQDVAGDWTLDATGDTASEAFRDQMHAWARTHPRHNLDMHGVTEVLVEAVEDWLKTGCLAVEIARNPASGEPELLTHIPAHTVRVHHSRRKFAQERAQRLVWFRAPQLDGDVEVDWRDGSEHPPGALDPEYRATDLVYLRDDDPWDDFYGTPSFSAATASLLAEQHRLRHILDLLRNGGEPRYAVIVTGDFDREVEVETEGENGETTSEVVSQQEAIARAVEQMRGRRDQNLLLTLPTRGDPEATTRQHVDVRFEALGADRPADAEWRGLRDDVIAEVLTSMRVPPYRVGIAAEGSLGGSTARESSRVYASSVVEPLQQRLESLLTAFVVEPRGGDGWAWRFARIDTRDRSDDSLVGQRLVRAGAMTPRELARHFAADFDLDADRAPDVYLVEQAVFDPESGEWTPLSRVGDDTATALSIRRWSEAAARALGGEEP